MVGGVACPALLLRRSGVAAVTCLSSGKNLDAPRPVADPRRCSDTPLRVLLVIGWLSLIGRDHANLDLRTRGSTTLEANFSFGGTATPLPAALPMFRGDAGPIGLLARRRKQKRTA